MRIHVVCSFICIVLMYTFYSFSIHCVPKQRRNEKKKQINTSRIKTMKLNNITYHIKLSTNLKYTEVQRKNRVVFIKLDKIEIRTVDFVVLYEAKTKRNMQTTAATNHL